MFDKILSRLGIYDILGVLITGICICTSSLLLLRLVGINIDLIRNETFIFLIFSYVIGLIFQEFTSLLQRKIFNRNNKLRLKSIKTKHNHFLYMEKYEIDIINEYIQNKLPLKDKKNFISMNEDINIVYDYCKNYMAKYGDSTGSNRDQAIAGMARSLALYCFLAPLFFLFLLSPYGSPNFSVWIYIAVSGVLFLLSVLFYYRFQRFTIRRIITFYKYYLYNQILCEKDNYDIKEKKNLNSDINK